VTVVSGSTAGAPGGGVAGSAAGAGRTCTTLLDDMRRAGRTEVKEGCREGRCGACAVVVGGELRLSCLVLAARVGDAEVVTTASAQCTPAREALVATGAIQCGYCTPGVAVALTWAVATGASLDEALAGTICRCGCHVGFREAAAALGIESGRDPGARSMSGDPAGGTGDGGHRGP
jgi:aerobic-type carbon monoxide dehydrogenase small subunit (CoxS/CutS family)